MQVQVKEKMKPQSVKIDPALLSRGEDYILAFPGLVFADLFRFALKEYLDKGDFSGVNKKRKYGVNVRVSTAVRVPLGMFVRLNEVARELGVDNCQVYEAAIKQYLNVRS